MNTIPQILRFEDIDNLTTSLSSVNDNIPIVRYPKLPEIQSSGAKERKKHFIRRESFENFDQPSGAKEKKRVVLIEPR